MQALLIDGFNLIRRLYAATYARGGEPADIIGYQQFAQQVKHTVARALSEHTPSHAVLVLEQSGPNWRHRLLPSYKKNRSAPPEGMTKAMPQIESAIATLGVPSVALRGYEADDIIASIAIKIAQHNGQSVILTTDLNQCQIMQAHIRFYHHFERRYITEHDIENKFHIKPWQLPDYLALTGDSSVSIAGVGGIGHVTAAKLLHDYRNLDDIYAHLDDIQGKIGSKLYHGKEQAILAKSLFSLKTDIELGLNLNQCRLQSNG